MLPERWTDSPDSLSGPEYLSIPGQLDEVVERYLIGLDGGDALERLLSAAVGAGVDTVMVERDYIDADYRDEFAHFYAQTFRPVPDRCQRLHFMNRADQQYLGFCVLRPLTGRPVSRSMMVPPPGLEPAVSCRATSHASPYGYRFGVIGFPFYSQDYQYGVCAHAAIWMVAHYFHLRFRRPRYYLSDIVEAALVHPSGERQVPSTGLTRSQIGGVLEALRMPAIAYPLDALPDGESPEAIACRYLNSGLPVIVLGSEHARVLIGYGTNPRLYFVCNDDIRGPYRAVETVQAGYLTIDSDQLAWDHLLVPLPGRIYLTGEAAEREGRVALIDQLARVSALAGRVRDLEDGRLRLRTYVIESGEYKRRLRRRELPDDVIAFHARVSCSHWVWVVELQDREAAKAGRRCVLGEVVIDSTSDDLHPNYLMANLPGRLMRWPALGAETEWTDSSQSELYLTGAALHGAPIDETRVDRLRRRWPFRRN